MPATPLYCPTRRQAVWLLALTLAALSYGFVMRYRIIQDSSIGISCEGGLATWLCNSRHVAIALYTPQIFGFVALGAALLHFLRPSFIPFAIALVAAGAGIVLYNVALAALSVAILIFSFARPVPESG
jgi:hypothetical protein